MKKIYIIAVALLVLVGTYLSLQVGKKSVEYVVDSSDILNPTAFVFETPVESLSIAEANDLTKMREEEKLARDVYTTLFDMWGIRLFANITASEQTHMDTLGALIKRYGIEDPVRDATVGVFTNTDIQKLYTDLIAQGSISATEALAVGATIEDLDIKDLIEATERTDKADITRAYANLQKGSRNHMRAFVRNIESQGAEYTPQFITREQYQAITTSPQERGRL